MKRYEYPPIVVSLCALAGSIICLFLPFITIPGYRPISGIELVTRLFVRFPIDKMSKDVYETLSFYSYSLPLLVSALAMAVSLILLAGFFATRKVRWMNYSILATAVGFVGCGVQLINSNTMVTDFFGVLSQSTLATKGRVIYQVPNVTGVALGLGPALYALFGLIALLSILVAKFFEHEYADRSSNLQTPLSIAYRQFKRNKLAMIGLFVLLFMVIAAFYGPVLSHYAMLQTDINIAKQPPSAQFLFGTDSNGRDGLTRLLYGGRVSLEIGVVVVLIEVVIGTVIGGVAGFYGGWVDNVLMRLDDIFLSLPMFPLVIIIGAVMMDMKVDPSKRIYFVMLILGLLFWPSLARLVRGQILSLREQEFMVAAEALGIRDRHRIFRHLIPNALPNIIVTATLDIGNAILTESALSFLGLGVAIPYPSWGNIIQAVDDPNDFALRPWLWIPAGICILLTVLAINLVGDGLRDAFDPKMKR